MALSPRKESGMASEIKLPTSASPREAFADPAHPGNQPSYHTGKECIERDCHRPAGTAWSPLWCFECNVERMRRIGAALEKMRGL